MGASRLPGKPLFKVLGRPLLSYLLERLKRVSNADKIIVATSTHPRDILIAEAALSNGVEVFKGSEGDVLDRYYQAAKGAHADVIVRITADCPLIDPILVTQLIDLFKSLNDENLFASNTLTRTFPRGMDTEVFSFKALEEAWQNATLPYEREHVTPYLYTHPEKFSTVQLTQNPDQSYYRWTVDTLDDFRLISKLLAAIYPSNPNFSLKELNAVYAAHPEWHSINAHIQQKNLTTEKT
jgi:spore coat polysaccharide biosynthesis protein SpsF